MVRALALMVGVVAVGVMTQASRGEATTRPAEPSTRPYRPYFDRRNDASGGRPWRERLGSFDPSAMGGGPMTEREKDEIQRFMREHSPRRMKRLEEVPDDREEGIYRRIAHQYRGLQRLKEEDPEIYELRLKRLPIEDEMFALGWDLNHDDPKKPKDAVELRSKLREQVRLFVESSLQERKTRIDRNLQRLKREQQDLERAQVHFQKLMSEKEALIEKGVTGIENERGDALKELAAPILTSPFKDRDRKQDSAEAEKNRPRPE